MKKFFTFLSIILALSSCSTKQDSQQKLLTVKIDTVKTYLEGETTSISGKVYASNDVNMAFRVSGTLLRTPIKEGTLVKKGTLLAEIDPRDYRIQLQATEAEYKQIKGDAERVIELYKKNSISQSEYDKAVYGLQQITAKYHAHQNALADTRLVAPFDGYIQEYKHHEGETVAAGYPVVTFYNNANSEIEVNIPSSIYTRRNEFAQVSCMIDGKEVKLNLISISPKANLNQLYTARFAIDGSVQAIAGTLTNVNIYYSSSSNQVAIPLTAILHADDKSFVWIYKQGKVEKRIILIDEILASGQALVSGHIAAGELIVSGGVNSLKEGDQVTPLTPQSKTNIGGLL